MSFRYRLPQGLWRIHFRIVKKKLCSPSPLCGPSAFFWVQARRPLRPESSDSNVYPPSTPESKESPKLNFPFKATVFKGGERGYPRF